MKFKPSKFQQDIFDWVESGSGSGIVNAVAGSGKTTTIVQACGLIPKETTCAFLAFNKAIAVELGKRLPKHVESMTLNSMGFRAWGRHVRRRLVVEADKTRTLCRDHLTIEEKRLMGPVMKLVSLAKAYGVAPDRPEGLYDGLLPATYETWSDLIERHDVDVDWQDMALVVTLANMILEQSARSQMLIDFDDQLWLPLINRVPMRKYQWVIVDEAQDLSAVNRALIRRSLQDDGRLLAVGDPCQAIYGFRGADSESMDRIKVDFDCREMRLSISYRCPKSVVRKAQTIVPHIEASETAPEGVVRESSCSDAWTRKEYKVGDMVICRLTAPLVELAYALLTQKIPAKMLGRDIGEGLIKLIEKMKPQGIEGEKGLITKLEAWAEKEIDAALKKGKEQRAQSIEDKHQSIVAFVRGCKAGTVPKLKEEIKNLFAGGDDNRVVLSTIHKAKGLEADRVIVYLPELMPSKFARQPWQLRQERNLMYVAYTRAMCELILLHAEEYEHGEAGRSDDDAEAAGRSADHTDRARPNGNGQDETSLRSGAEAVSGPDAGGRGSDGPCDQPGVGEMGSAGRVEGASVPERNDP